MSRILLLIGSPKPDRSTSLSIAEYIGSKLEENGAEAVIEKVVDHIGKEDGYEDIFKLFNGHDQVVLISPLYVDSLPWTMIRTMEEIFFRKERSKGGKGLSSIINCGFPEASQNETATSICEMFARRMGMRWMGGLMLGGGGAISGKTLESRGFMVRNVRRSLDIAAGNLSRGEEISDEAKRLMEKKLIPHKLYTAMGNMGWKRQGRKNGVDLDAAPYAK